MKKKFTLPQVLIAVAIVFLIGLIVPSLLDAESDVSILIGVMIVVSIFYGVIKYGKRILLWIGFDLDDDRKGKGRKN